MEKKNVIKFHVKKTYKGLVSVRSTIIDLARQKNLPIELTCTDYPGAKMIIKDLSTDDAHKVSGPYKSKINDGEEYFLYDYIFENSYED
jgi:hypothetical protein